MSSQSQMAISSRRVLVLIPSGMNYFYELHGHRLAEALRNLGFLAEVGNLSEQLKENYDWCVLTNISEILLSYGPAGANDANMTAERERLALAAIRRLHQNCRAVACCSLDCASTTWYEWIQRRCQATGINTILDFGLHDQSAALSSAARALYHYLPNGLTPTEQEAVRRAKNDEEERPIPWLFVGHATAHRVALVDHFVTHVDPCGFVYMPSLSKVTAKDSQHLNQQQYDTVMRKSRYQIWCSHHQHFYLESERFRMSLLAGCVPIKVVSEELEIPSEVPFDYLVVRESEAAEKVRQFNFQDIRRRFQADFLAFPSLAAALEKFLISQAILPPVEANSAERSQRLKRVG
ncbi:MAG: hypothetical protein ACYC3I_02455 [Gemmataceae bacterium]